MPLRIVLKQLAVEDASVVMTDHTKARLLTVEGADFRSAFEVEGGIAQGSGEATIATVNLADLLFLRGVEAPLSMSKETVKLAPIRGRVAGGTATGDLTVHLKGGFRYVANLEVKGANVKTLLAEAKSAGGVSGTLAAKATFEGSGGLPTMKGRGQGTITDCRVEHGRTLALLAGILQVPELASPDFDECRAEFTQSGSRLSTPVLSLKGQAVQLTGSGHRQPGHLRPRLPDEPRARPQALREGHPPRAEAGVPAAWRRVLRDRLPALRDDARPADRPRCPASGRRPPPRRSKDQLNRLFKRKVF